MLAAFCLLTVSPPARAADSAQENRSQLIVPLKSGAFVTFTTEAAPAGSPEVSLSFIESEDKPNLIHRVFVDKANELFFGYELLVEPVAPGARQFRVSVRPLSAEYLQALRARPAFQRRKLHPSYNDSAFSTAPQTVGDGDTFALDVLQSTRTGAKIVDVITVSLSDPRLQEPPASATPARDYTLEDVYLHVTDHKLLINGEPVFRGAGGGCAGPLVWFSLRERGRFIFSLVPRAGYDFQKVGRVEHNKISLTWGGDRYEWVSSAPVVGIGGNWNLWVLHDPDYSFGLFDQAEARKGGAESFDESLRKSARRARSRAGFGVIPEQPEQSKPARQPDRVNVIIGAANTMESLLPKKQ